MSYRVLTIAIEKKTNVHLLMDVTSTLSGSRPTHAQAIHVMPSCAEYITMSPYVQGIPVTNLYERYKEICEDIRTTYSEGQKAYADTITWEWQDYEGYLPGDYSPYISHSLVSDLVICAKPPDVSLGSALPRTLIKESSAPVLVVPEDMDPNMRFERILLAWNETPEAANAIRNALPLIKQADIVVVVNVSAKSNATDLTGVDIGRYLGEHDIQIEIDNQQSSEGIGTAILEHAKNNYMDLLVMGGFGHSSVYNMVFGAATPEILRKLSCPVFLSR